MSVTPQITLNIELLDSFGAPIGSTAKPAFVRVALCGFLGAAPRVPGTAFIGKIATWPLSDFTYTGSPISFALFGNDVITPAGTYYMIEVLDENKNIVQANAYQFAGGGTYDLSALATYNPPNPPFTAPAPVLLNPQGGGSQTINGSLVIVGVLTAGSINNFFTKQTVAYSATPVFNLAQGQEIDMTLTGNVTSSTLSNATSGLMIVFKITQDGTGGRTFVFPANFKGAGVVDPTAAATSFQAFWYDGVNALATGPMISY